MIIKHPSIEEYVEILNLNKVAFLADWYEGQSTKEIISDLKDEYKDKLNEYLSTNYSAFSNEGQLMANTIVNQFQAYFFGETVALSGIGAVATFPEYRRSGAIRKIMECILEDNYKEGYAFSYLYPFSHHFYRKFGYESHSNITRYNLNLSSFELRRPSINGSWTMLRSKEDPLWIDVVHLYESYASQMNLGLIRDEDRWSRFKNANPYTSKQFTYLFKDEDQKPLAYVCFQASGSDGRHINIIDMAFTKVEGLEAILDFTRRYRSDFDLVTLLLPRNYPLFSLVTEIPETRHNMGMVRIINVKKVLSLLPKPKVTADKVIQISVRDEQIRANNNSFFLSIKKDSESIHVLDAIDGTVDAHLKIDIRALSVLVTGDLSFDCYLDSPQIDFDGDLDLLKQVFLTHFNMQNDSY